jgi:hypothetical protein
MKEERRSVIITILMFALIVFAFGFVTEVRYSQCALPDLTIKNTCPTMCDCNRSLERCQISECDHLDCINWYWMCVYKWR